MKKRVIILLLVLLFPLFVHAETLTEEQRALQEVMNAYYARTDKINYNASLGYMRLPPEEFTSQYFGFFDCVRFVVSVYYQALGVNVVTSPNAQAYYANKYNGDHKDIIYWHNVDDTNISNEEFAKKLKVGDIIGYTSEDSVGHVGLVYDITEKGEPIIIHTQSADNTDPDKYPNKIDYRGNTTQPFNYKFSSLKEGGIKRCNAFVNCKGFTNVVKGKYMWIIRPTFTENGKKYYYSTKCTINSNNKEIVTSKKNNCDISDKTEYSMPNTSKQRIKYPKIYIGKTVDKVNGSVVTEGSTLKYTIVVKNQSENKYGSFSIVENIPSYVTVKEISNGGTLSGSKITWNISSLNANGSTNVSYSVQVKSGYYGKEIKSTGTVAGIASSTVVNKIGYNLTSAEQTKIKDSYNKLKGKYKGVQLVNEVYKDAFNLDLKLMNNFVLGAQYYKYKLADGSMISTDYNANYKEVDKKSNPYYRDYDSDVRINIHPIIISMPYNKPDLGKKVTLNKYSPYYNIVLNNYYSSLSFNYEQNPNYDGNKRIFRSKGFESVVYDGTKTINYTTTRSRYINVYNLMNGDILIYSNKNDVKHPNENGDYAFIFIDGKFVGNNGSITIGDINKSRFGTSGYIDNVLQTLFTKDFYVIMRPALQMNKVDVTSIKLSKTTAELNIGASLTLTATISPSNATNKTITWTSSNTNVATVSNGKVTGVKAGTATITAKSNNGKIATATITVKSTTTTPTQTTPTTTNTTSTITVPVCNNLEYNGKEQLLIVNSDKYTLTNNNATNAGSYIVSVKLKSNYKWGDSTTTDKKITCVIKQKDISSSIVDGITNQAYTGKEIKPIPKIKIKMDKEIVLDNKDYNITYKDNIKPGTAKITINGIGNYKGSKTVSFIIYQANNNDLGTLKINNQNIVLGSSTSYSIDVPNVDNITIAATAVSPNSKIEGIGTKTLVKGKNVFNITVIAEDGSKKIYTVNINKTDKLEEPKQENIPNIDNSTLETKLILNKLVVNNEEIKLEEDNYTYKVVVNNKNKLDIEYALNNENTNVEIVGNENIEDGKFVEIILSDENGNETKYVLRVEMKKELNPSNYILYAAIALFGILGLMFVVSFLDAMLNKK